MKDNIIKEKSYQFALKIIAVYSALKNEKEFILSKQLLRCGTSIGANVEEATQAESKADFIHKLSVALKESFETNYWLRLLRDSGFIKGTDHERLLNDCIELQRIITAIIKTAKANK